MKIVLCGMMGAGKTTVGALLAKLLGWRFVDSDEEIAKRFGTIADLFQSRGERWFREAETEIIREVCLADRLVLSTGGGAVLKEENRSLFKKDGFVVYLTASVELLEKRLQGNTARPLLQGGNLKARLEKLLQERAKLYEELADVTVSVDGKSVQAVAREIIERRKGAGVQ